MALKDNIGKLLSSSTLVMLASLCLASITSADASRRYNMATQLNLRAEPTASAPVLARWPINQPMTLLAQKDSRWCEVAAPDTGLRGFVDCRFLAATPLTLEKTEEEALTLALELNRLKPPRYSGEDLAYRPLTPQAAQAMRSAGENLLTLLERRFALSSSLHAYGDYTQLRWALIQAIPEDSQDSDLLALRKLAQSRAGQADAMWASLSRDFSKGPPPAMLRHSLGQRMDELLRQRRYGGRAGDPLPQTYTWDGSRDTQEALPPPSLFRQSFWAAGLVGGPLVARQRGPHPEGVAYTVGFGEDPMNDIYEMAKTLGTAIRISRSPLPPEFQYDPQNPRYSTRYELQLPIWAITENGLVQGKLLHVNNAGGACSDMEGGRTDALVVFPRPVQGRIHGFFASNADIDPARAQVSVRKRTFLQALSDLYENTFTHRVDMSVDLDGDGVADLRTVISEDTAVSRWERREGGGDEGWSLWPVAGWYAHNLYLLQANEEGRWRTLSRYALVTCT